MKNDATESMLNAKDRHVINFEQYLGLLLKWNRTYNLTSITDPIEVYEKHFTDSITPLHFIPKDAHLLDIGTGAGFPGIPLKILRDDITVTLIEATSKKVNFCQHIIGVLRLKNIRVIHGRAEEPATMKVVGKMDVVISRATLKLPTFIKAGCPYLKPHGLMIAMLGSGWADEIDRAIGHIKRAGLNIVKIHEYILPVSQSQRALVIFEKK